MILSQFSGKSGDCICVCPADVQAKHFATVATPIVHPDFDSAALEAAKQSVESLMSRSFEPLPEPQFTVSHVGKAFSRLKERAASIDGVSKRWAKPAAAALLEPIAELFSHLYSTGESVDDWTLGIVTSIKKKMH